MKRGPEGLLGSNPFDPKMERFKQPDWVASKPAAPEAVQDELPMFGLPNNMNAWDAAHRATFKKEAPQQKWEQFDRRKLTGNETGVNLSEEVYLNNDKSRSYFMKTRTSHGNITNEIAALNVGDALGVNVLPVIPYSHGGYGDALVTPWVKGKAIGNSNSTEVSAILRAMDPKARDKQLFFEFLIADTDKHDWNYFVDKAHNKIVGIDYGKALVGDQHTIFDRNSFVRALLHAMPQHTPLSRDAIKEILAGESKATEIIAAERGISKGMLDGLKERFDILRRLAARQGELTYADVPRLARGG